MPPKKKSCEKKKDRRFKVDGKEFRTKEGSWTRFRLCKNGTFEKIKPDLWTDEANDLWNKVVAAGKLANVANIKLNRVTIDKSKIKKKKTKPKAKPKAKPSPKPELKKTSPKKVEEKEEEPSPELKESCEELLKTIIKSSQKLTLENEKYQQLLKCIEEKNKKLILENKVDTNSLYPSLDDPNFTEKISIKKEFNDVKIEKKTQEEIDNIEEIANKLCSPNLDFELEPHQMFIRNFLSFQTPYNGLLLFHGLGTGKTCSSISVCEDMRTYYQQLGIKKKIMIVASPVVQENYKLQLFDKRKLKEINGLWNIKACTGNKFIKEVNPMNMKGLTKEKVVMQIKKIIRQSYEFIGYTEFANIINKLVKKSQGKSDDDEKRLKRKISAIRKEFSDRLLVIDEVHNIRTISTKKTQIRRTTQNMLDLVRYAENMKLMLLTATPMFNDATEIIWIANLLNLNDKRFPIETKDVFDKDKNFLKDDNGNDIGKELLIQKLIGYVSYVSGENPFTFPYKIWPSDYKNPHSLTLLQNKNKEWEYPKYQINSMEITEPIKYLDLIITSLHQEQNEAYNYVIRKTKEKYPILNEKRLGIQYTVIDGPQQALNMIYPNINSYEDDIDMKSLYGMTGLKRTMHFNKDTLKNFSYERKIVDKFGRLFSSDGGIDSPLKKYSAKIYSIMENVKKSKGIVLIYSNYVAGGCIPLALALEELGFQRYGGAGKSLFEERPKQNIGNYVMITGDKRLSPSPKRDLEACTDVTNINGEKVKVIIISRAGSEGLDFKNIRQVHILEPWFNLNRTDQIVGRGVRNKSHCALPFNERTVQVFLYGSQLMNPEIEPIDLYVYRLAEYKSIQIGKVSRVLKENAIDCLINKNQQDMLANNLNKEIGLKLSTDEEINFKIGHKNYSLNCDYMECEYNCNPKNTIDKEITTDSYSQSYIIMNLEKILKRVKSSFKEHYIYKKDELIKRINAVKTYSNEQINMALDVLINDKNEYLIDMLNRTGRLVNIDDFYLFQPIELDDKHITSLERRKPIDIKIPALEFILPENIEYKEEVEVNDRENLKSLKSLKEDYHKSIGKQYKEVVKNKEKSLVVIKPTDWINSAIWAIDNLVKHDNLDRNDLERFCLEHLFDVLNINEKLQIMNALLKDKGGINQDFKKLLLSITDENYVIKKGNTVGFVVADYKKQYAGEGNKLSLYVFILDNEKNQWVTDKLKIPILLPDILKKYKHNISIFNDNVIGFLTMKGKNKSGIVFKTKSMKPLGKKKRETGLECPSKGENRRVTLDRINYLVKHILVPKKTPNVLLGKEEKRGDKYKMKDKNNRTSTIYDKDDIQSGYIPKVNDKIKVKISSYKKDKRIKNNKYYDGIVIKVNDNNTYNIKIEAGKLWKRKEKGEKIIPENPEELFENIKNVHIKGAEDIAITDTQLCVETELLLRYLDKRDGPDKKWFFSTVEDVLNNIKDKTLK